MFIYILAIHYIASRYPTTHDIPLHIITPGSIAYQYIPWHSITSHYTPLRTKTFLTLQCTTLHYIAEKHYIPLQIIARYSKPLRSAHIIIYKSCIVPLKSHYGTTSFHFSQTITYHYIMVHAITYHYIMVHAIACHCIVKHTIAYHRISWHTSTSHHITSHYVTLRYITLLCVTLHYITLRYIHYECITSFYSTYHTLKLYTASPDHYATLYTIAHHSISSHTIANHCYRCISLCTIACHYILLHATTYHYITLHYITLHCIALQCMHITERNGSGLALHDAFDVQ